jgi:YgiT-type zinc finger domain-containing protein
MKCENCGKKVQTILGDTIIKVDDTDVKVSNIPVFKCSNCGKQIIHAVIIERAMKYAQLYGVQDNQIDFGVCEQKEGENMPITLQGLGIL